MIQNSKAEELTLHLINWIYQYDHFRRGNQTFPHIPYNIWQWKLFVAGQQIQMPHEKQTLGNSRQKTSPKNQGTDFNQILLRIVVNQARRGNFRTFSLRKEHFERKLGRLMKRVGEKCQRVKKRANCQPSSHGNFAVCKKTTEAQEIVSLLAVYGCIKLRRSLISQAVNQISAVFLVYAEVVVEPRLIVRDCLSSTKM